MGELANGHGSLVALNGLNRSNYSNGNDGSRGGQAFNDQLYAGLASPTYGQLTFGRHLTFSGEFVGACDPAASTAFSVIGYSGSYGAALSFTGDTRWDDSFKYRVEYGAVRFGAMYKFADGNSGSNIGPSGAQCAGANLPVTGCAASTLKIGQNYSSQNDAAQVALGGSYAGFDVDCVLGYYHQAASLSALSAAQFGGIDNFTSNTFVSNVAQVTNSYGNINPSALAATIADTTGGAIGAKYTWNQFKFFAGWSHQIFHNPENMVGIRGQADQGGYVLSSVNNGAYPHARLLDTEWVGFRYAYDPKTEIAVGYYHANQNGYGWATGAPGVSTGSGSASLSTCSLPAFIAYRNVSTKVRQPDSEFKL